MGKNSSIEWCHHTVNFWWGCAKVSPACAHCYAESMAVRWRGKTVTWGKDGKRWIRTAEAEEELRLLDADARRRGVRERVFINSMSDTFEDRKDLWQARNNLFVAAEKRKNLDFLLLTKRPQNVLPMLEKIRVHWGADKLPLFPNVWIGTTVEDQQRADERIPELLKIPAAVRFLSCEPLLGRVLLDNGSNSYLTCTNPAKEPEGEVECCESFAMHGDHFRGIDWVICGGESGVSARPMHPDWAQSLWDQCRSAGVPFFFKQWGEWKPICEGGEDWVNRIYKSNRKARPHEDQGAIDESYGKRCTVPMRVLWNDGSVHELLEPLAFNAGKGAMSVYRVGTKKAGRELGGVRHDAFPAKRKEAALAGV